MITYSELLLSKNGNYISYEEKLATTEWQAMRNQIIVRDSHTCFCCNKKGSIIQQGKAYRYKTQDELEIDQKGIDIAYEEGLNLFKSLGFGELPQLRKREVDPLIYDLEPVFLHVHHKYYIKGRNPWEYPEVALMCVCQDCHQKIHEVETIPVYSDESIRVLLDYNACLKCKGSGYLPEYHYYKQGICFKCNGDRYEESL